MHTFILFTFISFQVMTKTIFTKSHQIVRVAPSLSNDQLITLGAAKPFMPPPLLLVGRHSVVSLSMHM